MEANFWSNKLELQEAACYKKGKEQCLERRFWLGLSFLVPVAWFYFMSKPFYGIQTGFSIFIQDFDSFYEREIGQIRSSLILTSFVFLSIFGLSLYMMSRKPPKG